MIWVDERHTRHCAEGQSHLPLRGDREENRRRQMPHISRIVSKKRARPRRSQAGLQ